MGTTLRSRFAFGRRPFLASLAFGAFFATQAQLATADIFYKVAVHPDPDQSRLLIEMKVPTKAGPLVLQAPNWAPGAYIFSPSGTGVLDFKATDKDGKPLDVQHVERSNTWVVSSPGGDVIVTYARSTRIGTDSIAHYSGPSTYLYVVDRKTEKCHLDLVLPALDWNIGIGLDPEGKSGHQFSAPTYDVLADTPVTVGKFLSETYMSHGKPHMIVLYGPAKEKTNREVLRQACQFVSDAEGNFFGEVPYKRYVWHFSVNERPDGAGGLEHLNGTEIGLSSGVGWLAQSVLAHEFFHLWNVKRIRSRVLGPFDYTQLPKTGALWWLEGVTDYYASVIPFKYGWWGTDRAYALLGRNIQDTNSNPGRFQISPYDSSYRVGEAANGRGNSNGLLVSYYNTGWLLGLLLDIEIREKSGGKHSLDDVELALWNECKNDQPGFPEDEIRKGCVRFGGDALGTFYDTYVMKPGDLPIDAELAKIGLVEKTETRAVLALEGGRQTGAGYSLGFGVTALAIDGVMLNGTGDALAKQVQEILSHHQAGDKLTVKVRVMTGGGGGFGGGGAAEAAQATTEDRTVAVISREVKSTTVTEDPNASPAAVAMRKAWRSPRPGTKPVMDAKP
jgi:predicted metalloprotease with PDZ domain